MGQGNAISVHEIATLSGLARKIPWNDTDAKTLAVLTVKLYTPELYQNARNAIFAFWLAEPLAEQPKCSVKNFVSLLSEDYQW